MMQLKRTKLFVFLVLFSMFSCENMIMRDQLKPLMDARIPSYMVNFNSNGGSIVEHQSIENGEKVTKPSNPSFIDYDFIAWFTEDSYMNQWDFDTDVVTADITLYAKWALVSYTVTFHAQGGSAVENQTIELGEKVTKPADPTRVNYDFVGWYKEETYANAWDFDTDAVTEDITLYAQWSLNPSSLTYTVLFESNGGTSINPITNIAYNDTIIKPADPARPGFGLNGWYKDVGLSDDWNFATDAVTENRTLYAKWTRNTLDITLDVGDITDINPSFPTIVISKTAAAPYFTTANVSVTESAYDSGSITWMVPKVGMGTDVTGTGASFELDAENVNYNTTGVHFLKLEVKIGGVSYSKNIPFTIVD
jgi:uncharacterized repeat protein (TIGR02543 family)